MIVLPFFMFLAYPSPKTYQEPYVRLQALCCDLDLVHRHALEIIILKLCSKVSACLNFYFALITCCLARFHAHTYYYCRTIFWFVNSRGLALKYSLCPPPPGDCPPGWSVAGSTGHMDYCLYNEKVERGSYQRNSQRRHLIVCCFICGHIYNHCS